MPRKVSSIIRGPGLQRGITTLPISCAWTRFSMLNKIHDYGSSILYLKNLKELIGVFKDFKKGLTKRPIMKI